ncbi:MAG: hypothetical protein GY694_01755 [Gammaproteobacteria bacterium]|nr:hypothetical protein [Gammaproteobacteria bacterium]
MPKAQVAQSPSHLKPNIYGPPKAKNIYGPPMAKNNYGPLMAKNNYGPPMAKNIYGPPMAKNTYALFKMKRGEKQNFLKSIQQQQK